MVASPVGKTASSPGKPAPPKEDPGEALEAVLKKARLDIRKIPTYLKEIDDAAKGAKADKGAKAGGGAKAAGVAKPGKPAPGGKGGKPAPPKPADSGGSASLTKLIESCRDAAKLIAGDKKAFADMMAAAQAMMKSRPAKPGASPAELGDSLGAVRGFLLALKKQV